MHEPVDVVGEMRATRAPSVYPIREALQQLRGEGFVVITPNRGARVDGAARIVEEHVRGSGRHLVEHIQLRQAARVR